MAEHEPLSDEQLRELRVRASGNPAWLKLLDEHAALRRERELLIKALAARTAVYDVHGDRSPMWMRLRGALDTWLRFDAEREGKGKP